jgi:hypothetical protein
MGRPADGWVGCLVGTRRDTENGALSLDGSIRLSVRLLVSALEVTRPFNVRRSGNRHRALDYEPTENQTL